MPNNINHKIYFDNYYTSIKLMVHLAHEELYTLGTVRQKCIPNNKMASKKEIKKKKVAHHMKW